MCDCRTKKRKKGKAFPFTEGGKNGNEKNGCVGESQRI